MLNKPPGGKVSQRRWSVMRVTAQFPSTLCHSHVTSHVNSYLPLHSKSQIFPGISDTLSIYTYTCNHILTHIHTCNYNHTHTYIHTYTFAIVASTLRWATTFVLRGSGETVIRTRHSDCRMMKVLGGTLWICMISGIEGAERAMHESTSGRPCTPFYPPSHPLGTRQETRRESCLNFSSRWFCIHRSKTSHMTSSECHHVTGDDLTCPPPSTPPPSP